MTRCGSARRTPEPASSAQQQAPTLRLGGREGVTRRREREEEVEVDEEGLRVLDFSALDMAGVGADRVRI